MTCLLCRGTDADEEIGRIEVWSDELWRMTMSVAGQVAGFSFLEPRRHIPHITDLDGAEAATFGEVMARCSRALKDVTGAEAVYVYVFGTGIPHLHVHLAPHKSGDVLNDSILRGEVIEERLPTGMTRLRSVDFEELDAAAHRQIIDSVKASLQLQG